MPLPTLHGSSAAPWPQPEHGRKAAADPTGMHELRRSRAHECAQRGTMAPFPTLFSPSPRPRARLLEVGDAVVHGAGEVGQIVFFQQVPDLQQRAEGEKARGEHTGCCVNGDSAGLPPVVTLSILS